MLKSPHLTHDEEYQVEVAMVTQIMMLIDYRRAYYANR